MVGQALVEEGLPELEREAGEVGALLGLGPRCYGGGAGYGPLIITEG